MPSIPVLAVSLLILFALVGVLQWSRRSQRRRAFDAGSVSTRWIAELRRDEPWTGR